MQLQLLWVLKQAAFPSEGRRSGPALPMCGLFPGCLFRPAPEARRARLTIPSGRTTRLPQGVSSILLSWVFSPVLTGGLSFLLFGLLRNLVLRSPRAYHRAYYVLPLFVFITTFVIR